MPGTGIDDISVSVQSIFIEPTILIDEASTIDFYIGVSNSFSDPAQPNWRIKRIYKVGNVWKQGYPDGDQHFIFVWDLRPTYVYS